MGRTFTDFSQLSKGMFRKGEPVVEKKAADLERQLAEERAARQTAEAERERLRGEVLRLRNEHGGGAVKDDAPCESSGDE